MMKRHATVAAVIWGSLGCGAAEGGVPDGAGDGSAAASSGAEAMPDDSTQASSERRICDGSAGIRLAMYYGGGGPFSPYISVFFDLGTDFLYVDGSCHYWAQPFADQYYLWRPYREGVLTPADEQRLHDAVGYDGFPADTCVPRTPVYDGATASVWDGRSFRSCADDMFDGSGPLRAELYDAATPLTGPMRIQLGKGWYTERPLVYDWPLAAPIDQFAIEPGDKRSFRIDDVEDTTALRSLRDRVIQDSEASSSHFTDLISIRSSQGNESYFMSLRDELPFVGADGTWVAVP
jgi:hypothetical protein